MQKIMFNKPYGLQHAVECGYKTMTRRPVGKRMTEDDIRAYLKGYTELANKCAQYKIGEVVAVAQAYKDIEKYNPESYEDVMLDQGTICEASHPYSHLMKSGGWDNKMFVRADLMPLKIQISDIKIERLHEISEEDALKEGIYGEEVLDAKLVLCYAYTFYPALRHYDTAREAFYHLIDKVSGKGTWERNDWQFAYTFKLVK